MFSFSLLTERNKTRREGNWYFWYLLTEQAIRSPLSTTISSVLYFVSDKSWQMANRRWHWLQASLLLTPEFIGKFKFNKNGINFLPTNSSLSCPHTKLEMSDKIYDYIFIWWRLVKGLVSLVVISLCCVDRYVTTRCNLEYSWSCINLSSTGAPSLSSRLVQGWTLTTGSLPQWWLI